MAQPGLPRMEARGSLGYPGRVTSTARPSSTHAQAPIPPVTPDPEAHGEAQDLLPPRGRACQDHAVTAQARGERRQRHDVSGVAPGSLRAGRSQRVRSAALCTTRLRLKPRPHVSRVRREWPQNGVRKSCPPYDGNRGNLRPASGFRFKPPPSQVSRVRREWRQNGGQKSRPSVYVSQTRGNGGRGDSWSFLCPRPSVRDVTSPSRAGITRRHAGALGACVYGRAEYRAGGNAPTSDPWVLVTTG